MKIAISSPEFFFSLFYVVSFVVTFILVIIFSLRHRIPLWSVLLMLTTVSLSTIIGSRLSTIPLSEWGQIILSGNYTGYMGRFAVGGLLFGLAGLIFSIRYLALGKPIIELYAWIAPIGFGIQKIGCFLNGCCYGKTTELPWGIQYPVGTNAHFNQWINGMIDENAIYSLGIHPVQLYEVIALFSIAFIVWKSRKFWKKSGSALIFSLCLFFIFRFFSEFLRDPDPSDIKNRLILGVSLLQWFLLTAGTACSLILFLYEKKSVPVLQKQQVPGPSFKRSILYVISVSAVIYIFRGLFTPFELLSLELKFVPAIFLTAYYVFKSLKEVRIRLATTSLFVLSLLLMSQTFLPDTTKSGTMKDFYKNEVKSYKRIDFGTSLGEFNNTLKYNPHEEECGTTYTKEDYKHVYRMAGAGYSSVKIKEKSITTAGINLYGGINKESNLTQQWEKSNFLLGVNPYFKNDLNWYGFGLGAHIGNLKWVPGSPIDKVSYDEGTKFSPLLPAIYLRIGRQDILDLNYNYGFDFRAPLPVLSHEFSVGSGFGTINQYSLRFGAAVTDNYSFPFISAQGLIDKKFGLTFKFNFGNGDFDYSSNNEAENKIGRIHFGANYRFGFKK